MNDFRADERGEYRYEGAWMRAVLSPEQWRHAAGTLAVAAGVLFACGIVCGCVPASVMGSRIYILLPYVAELALSFSLLYRSIRLLLRGRDGQVPEYIFLQTADKFPLHAGMLTAFAGVTTGANLIWQIIARPQGSKGLLLLWILLQAVILLVSIGFKKQADGISWVRQET